MSIFDSIFGSSSAPAAPDYSPLIYAAGGLGNQEQNLANSQLGWAQGAYGSNLGTTNSVIGGDQAIMGDTSAFGGKIQRQYENTYAPLEKQFVNEAENYASPSRIASEMGTAGATTAQTMDQGRENALNNLESFGISPDSTRYAALDIGAQAQKGAAVAGSENQARTSTINTGLGLQAQAIGQGLVQPSMVAGLGNTSLMAGSGAVNSGLATTASGANTMGTAPGYMGLAGGAYGITGNIMNMGYNNSLAQFNANQNASSGIGSLLGGVAGLGTGGGNTVGGDLISGMMFAAKGGPVPAINDHDEDDQPGSHHVCDENCDHGPFNKDHVIVIPGHDEQGRPMPVHVAMNRFFQTGQHHGVFPSMVHAHAHMQQQEFKKRGAHGAVGGVENHADGGGVGEQTPGGQVPVQASPSQGAVSDDVPAKLTADEFVIPRDVAKWKGQEFFQKLIDTSRKAKGEASAKPTVSRGAVPIHPAFMSRPGASGAQMGAVQ